MNLGDTPIADAAIFATPLFVGDKLLAEIRRQRRELLKKMKKPEVCYLGEPEYIEFRHVLRDRHDDFHFFHAALLSKGPPVEQWEGMHIIVRSWPGVHVCEAAP